LGKVINRVMYSKAIWDTSPIIRMFCAKLNGSCAHLRITNHILLEKVYEELRKRNTKDIKQQYDDRGKFIQDDDEARAVLNAIQNCSSLFSLVIPKGINICDVKKEFDLDESDGEFWVVAYALKSGSNKVVVIIDDGPALNEICRKYNDERHQFKILTSLHIIYLLTCKEQVITYKVGMKLFNNFYTNFFGRIDKKASCFLNLEAIFQEITGKDSKKAKHTKRISNNMAYVSEDKGWVPYGSIKSDANK